MPLFQPGCEPGPGRPRGSYGGRHRVLQLLDDLFAREENLEKLREALQSEFDADPPAFWRRYGAPTIPAAALVAMMPPAPDPMRELYASVVVAMETARNQAEYEAMLREPLERAKQLEGGGESDGHD